MLGCWRTLQRWSAPGCGVILFFFKQKTAYEILAVTGVQTCALPILHRKHHNFSDVEGDPHSPHIEGYWRIMLANVYYYRREANNDDTLEKYAADLPFDRLDEAIFRRGTLGFGLTGVNLVLLMGLGPGLVALTTLETVYLLLNAAIHGAGHTFDCKRFANDATKLKLLALITFGEGLHNNHHARPASAKLSAFRDEFDPAWPVIRLLEKLRLAEVLTKVDEDRKSVV